MKINSYEEVKKHILNHLQEKDNLTNDKIAEEIKNTKELSSVFGNVMFAKVLSVSYIESLSDKEWKTLEMELKQYFDVEMGKGILIQGEEQQNRDTVWWTDREKQKSDNYYWERYKEYIGKSLPPEVVRTIDVDTDNIMNNIEDPSFEKFSRYGMVVGHVQSGKTANYSSLVCKAADVGYKFIVVIAGGINSLRNQTQKRLNEAFIGKDEKENVGVGKFGGTKRELIPISLTTTLIDFNKQDAEKNSQGLNFDNVNVPILLVIKKHTKTLDNVIEWITNQYNQKKIKNHSVLVIDDESDYASINTKEEDNPTTINYKIRKLLNLFEKSAYIAYTATPYANIFIDHNVEKDDIGKDLFPKDFIYSLSAPSNYFGARKIFLDSDKKYLNKIDDFKNIIPLKHKKDFDLNNIPNSLYEAMRVFIINIAVRCLRGQGNKHNSMLIHITRFTRIHQRIAILVDDYINKIRKEINSYGALSDAERYSQSIKNIKETYELEYANLEFTWQEVLDSICNIIKTIVVREAHQKSMVKVEYRDNEVTNAIVIGGTSLARGFTLEGLSVSYFLRTTVFYDTLMQMGRWFGYRPNYEDLCKIYMTDEMMDNFAFIIESTEDLIDTFKIMQDRQMTPNDFGLAVRQHPDSVLQVTARNKQKNTKDYYFEMNLDGSLKETSWLDKNTNIRQDNLEAVKKIVKLLQSKKNKFFNQKKHYLWQDIEKDIIIDFLNEFKTYQNECKTYPSILSGLKSRMPIDFIKKYVEEVNTKWDVVLYSGNGENYCIENVKIKKEKRQIKIKDDYYEIKNRQVSSGNAESISFSDVERKNLKSNRKEIREQMKKPLLMLHIIETDNDEKIDKIAAFGISFPGGIKSCNKTIKLKVNTVYIEKLLKQENDFDD